MQSEKASFCFFVFLAISSHLFSFSGLGNSPLQSEERHVCPRLPTAEISLWCKHPCLSPWQPNLLPAVGCHASRPPPLHALPPPLALYCRWHVPALYLVLLDPSSYLHKLLSLRQHWFPRSPSARSAFKGRQKKKKKTRCMVLHPQLQECFHSGELPADTARVNCWNNSTTSKSPQRKRRRDITASGLNFRSPCLLCHPPTSSSLKNGAAWHVLGGGGSRDGWCKCGSVCGASLCRVHSRSQASRGGRRRPFFQNMSTQSDEKTLITTAPRGQPGPLGDNN